MDIVSCIAVDLGASSGRVILSNFDGSSIKLDEVYRFPNEPVRVGGRYCWDFFRLYYEILRGLKIASKHGENITSIGIDTWGVDYGLLDRDNNLIGAPIHYRDDRTEGIMDKVDEILPFSELYKRTGIQKMPINTIYQLYSDKVVRPVILENADTLLFMPDLFNYYLTGEKHNEYTISSTSQLINASSRRWDREIISELGLPNHIFQHVIHPGEIYGYLRGDVSDEVGLKDIPVIAVGSHDTASAVCGTPLKDKRSAYLSCGTWSLLGLERDEPVITEKSLQYNFTNEGGVGDTIRLLKNINGLWVIQQLRKEWSATRYEVSFGDIVTAARQAHGKAFCIDPASSRFMTPGNMIDGIVSFCKEHDQGQPEGLGEIAIAAYNGLVDKYKNTIFELEEVAGEEIKGINMVGGGIQDELLCELTAMSTGKEVIAGPIEASALGNAAIQLLANSYIDNIEEGRKIISRSFEQKTYETIK
jgi:rhamnulokinase